MAILQETKLKDQQVTIGIDPLGKKYIDLFAITATDAGEVVRRFSLRVAYQDLTLAQQKVVDQALAYLEKRLKELAEIA